MIITCEKCSTRFYLDETLVSDEGAKVRCSVCQNIFTAFPPSEKPPEPVVEFDDEPVSALSDEPGEDFMMEDDDFSGEFSLDLDTSDLDTPDMDSTDMDSADLGTPDSHFDLEETEMAADDEPSLVTLDDDDMDEEEFSFEDSEVKIEMETSESQEIGPDLELEDDDFSFDAGELKLEDDSGGGDDDSVVELELSDDFDGIEFEPLEEDFTGLEMESGPDDSENEWALDEPESDGPQLDELTLEESQDLEEVKPDFDESGLEEASLDEDDDFELEFDLSDDPEPEISEIEPIDSVELEIDSSLEPADDLSEDDTFEIEDAALEIEDAELEPAVISEEEDFSPYDEVLDQSTEPELEDVEEDNFSEEIMAAPLVEETDQTESDGMSPMLAGIHEEEEEQPTSAGPTRRKKKPLLGTPILILLLLFLLVIGAYIASLMTGYKIPYLSDIKIPVLEQIFKKQVPEPEIKPSPNQKSVNGRFVNNSSAGTLFVITGNIENLSKITYTNIEVTGSLITKGRVEAKTRSVYCGNIIPEDMLKNGNIADIDKILVQKKGKIDPAVKPGGSIPFMLVFSNLPDQLQNFTVKVSNFDNPMQQK